MMLNGASTFQKLVGGFNHVLVHKSGIVGNISGVFLCAGLGVDSGYSITPLSRALCVWSHSNQAISFTSAFVVQMLW